MLMLWLLWLGALLIWRLLALSIEWWNRSLRTRLLFIFFLVILPWALLPRILNPPQPQTEGEELRLSINARRAAEFTYRITGVWVQRLALEDIRRTSVASGLPPASAEESVSQVCLRGYTYFFVPWRRYRISLDPSGVTALSLDELSVDGSCWE
ncbi:MAG: hypothetical protein HC802_17340 [Caldilineaceae bacterium]|nr:hypothetical protein [Caldilineaceae bacterium]